MANIKISELNSITSIVGNDFLVFTDSGSTLVTFRVPVSSFANFFTLSGSAASSSWASMSLLSTTASFNDTASYSNKNSVGLFLKYDGTPNGTASYAIFSNVSLTSSFSLFSSSSIYSISSSLALRTPTASIVQTSSFACIAQNVNSSSTALTASFAVSASYIDLSLTTLPMWYGPFTSSGFSASKWGWSDPLNQGIPIMVLHDNTDVLFEVSCKVNTSRWALISTLFTVEARTLPITSSTLPGIYTVPTASNTPSNADDLIHTMTHLNDNVFSNRVAGRDYLFMYRKTLNRGSYIIWLSNKFYHDDTTNVVDIEPLIGIHFPNGSTLFSFGTLDDQATETLSTGQKTVWLRPMSGSHRTILYSSGKVKQGIMLSPTSSLGNETATSTANWGRVFALPFLITSQSIVDGFCSASCNYRSGSIASDLANIYTASFSASTSGLSIEDTTVAFLGNIPNVASHWTNSIIVNGIPLSCVPIRTETSSSKF